jgi:hypothetical protein
MKTCAWLRRKERGNRQRCFCCGHLYREHGFTVGGRRALVKLCPNCAERFAAEKGGAA